jgi:amino acid transporter
MNKTKTVSMVLSGLLGVILILNNFLLQYHFVDVAQYIIIMLFCFFVIVLLILDDYKNREDDA